MIEAYQKAGLEVVPNGHTVTLRLSRPEAGNSLDPDTTLALSEAWRQLADVEDVWVVVITGAGSRYFCTGSDLKLTPPPAESFASQLLNGRLVSILPPLDFPKPIIAAINGMAVGGGLELALACDIRVAAESAQFGLSEVRVGSLAGQGGTQRLPRAIPSAVAMKMLLTGDRIDAAEAHRVGLISDVVPSEELEIFAKTIADSICNAAPLSVRAARYAVHAGQDVPLEQGLLIESQLWGALRDTEDRLEGRAAFAEKRSPQWRGR